MLAFLLAPVLALRVMLLVRFKPITWYIEMHHVRAFFLCGVMTFKRKAYRGFCLPQNCQGGRCLSAEDKI